MADAWGAASYGLGAAIGWWFAFRYDPTGWRWITLMVAIIYSITAVLRLMVAILGAGHG